MASLRPIAYTMHVGYSNAHTTFPLPLWLDHRRDDDTSDANRREPRGATRDQLSTADTQQHVHGDTLSASIDDTLAQRLRAGDTAAFCSMFDDHYDALVAYAYRFVRRSAVAEELVQDVL